MFIIENNIRKQNNVRIGEKGWETLFPLFLDGINLLHIVYSWESVIGPFVFDWRNLVIVDKFIIGRAETDRLLFPQLLQLLTIFRKKSGISKCLWRRHWIFWMLYIYIFKFSFKYLKKLYGIYNNSIHG